MKKATLDDLAQIHQAINKLVTSIDTRMEQHQILKEIQAIRTTENL